MKKHLFYILLFLGFSLSMKAQDYYSRCQQLIAEKDTATLKTIIQEWENRDGESGDIYAIRFSYDVLLGMSDNLTIDTIEHGDEEAIELQDSTGNTVGTLYDTPTNEENTLKKTFEKIDEGIKKYPDRLDLALGKVHVLLSNNDYDEALTDLHKILDRSLANNNKWLWTHDESVPDDGKFFLRSCLQDYFHQLYNDCGDSIALSLVEDVLFHYPNSIYFLNDKAAIFTDQGKEQDAFLVMQRIHSLDPYDELVTGNLAFLYKKAGNQEQAQLLYRQLLNSKDEKIRKDAQEALNEMK